MSNTVLFFFWRGPICTIKLSQNSGFQYSTIKPDNIYHSTAETRQIWLFGGFEGVLYFFKKIKLRLDLKKSKLTHFKSEKYESSTKVFSKKYNLSIIALFESWLLKNNRHNYK